MKPIILKEKLHHYEQRTYFYRCRYCNKNISSIIDVYSEECPIPFPEGWGYLKCLGDEAIVLCEVCYPNFKEKLIPIRNEMIYS